MCMAEVTSSQRLARLRAGQRQAEDRVVAGGAGAVLEHDPPVGQALVARRKLGNHRGLGVGIAAAIQAFRR